MEFRGTIELGEGRLADLGERARDLKPLYKRWIGKLRAEAQRKFESNDWQPLAESTVERYTAERRANVTAQGKTRKSYQRRLFGQLRNPRAPGSGELAEAELRRVLRGDLTKPVDGGARYGKAIERLRKQLLRAQSGKRSGGERRRIEKHALLGKLKGALRGGIVAGGVFVENAVKYSGVHNRGGHVGHGATVPARPSLYITEELKAELRQIVIEHLMGIEH
jgi:hypothetical protein